MDDNELAAFVSLTKCTTDTADRLERCQHRSRGLEAENERLREALGIVMRSVEPVSADEVVIRMSADDGKRIAQATIPPRRRVSDGQPGH